MSAALCLAIWLAVAQTDPLGPPSASSEPPAPGDGTAADTTDDVTLLGQVRRVAFQVESLRGRQFARPPDASRVSAAALDAAVRARALRTLAAERVAARGRAWADLGLGTPDTPARIFRRLAADLPGVLADAAAGKVLMGPEFLTGRDFSRENPDDPDSVIFMSAGLRPDEPLLAHALLHLLVQESPTSEETTDAILTRAAWSEGQANLVAIRLLFRSLGIGDDLFQHAVDPSRVLGGRLLGEPTEGLPAAERALIDFVHEEGFAQSVVLFKKGGWRAVEQGSGSRTSSRDLLHLDRQLPAGLRSLPPASPPLPDEKLVLADEDSLGEEGVVVLVATLTGKDDLGLAAGDGWIEDSLQRWEYPDGQGITVWESNWGSDQDADEFVYAMGRCMEEGLGAARVEPTPGGGAGAAPAWTAVDRVYRLTRNARRVSLTAATAAQDLLIEKSLHPEGQKLDPRGSKGPVITKP